MKKALRISLIVLSFFVLIGCSEISEENRDNFKDTIEDKEPKEGEKENYTVTFITNGGTLIASQIVEQGDTLIYPDNPEKEGYIFFQWHISINLDNPFFSSDTITEDLTLYAVWVEVSEDDVVISFESEYGADIAPIVGEAGVNINEPVQPTDIFYDFVEWRIKGTTEAYNNFNVMPDESITLVAVWEKNDIYEITFYLNDTNEYETFLFTSGTTINLPDDPELETYVFLGWYMDHTFTTKFDEVMTMPANHIDVYGNLVLIEDYFYEVKFETNSDTLIDSQLRIIGEEVIEPNVPLKKGYIFEGWYLEDTYDNLYNFDQEQNNDITLYAKWTFDDTYTTTKLNISDHEIIEIILAQGEDYNLPQMFKEGYIFDWWFTNENYTFRYRDYLYFAQPLGYELNLYAKWIEAPNVVYVELETNGGTEGRFSEGGGIIKTGTIQANPEDNIIVYNPSRDGYDFQGWYLDEAFTSSYSPISFGSSYQTIEIPNNDITMYAKWVSTTTGEVDDGSSEANLSLINKLEDFGFVCSDTTCILEEYQDYNYIFNLDTNTLSYVINVDQVSSGGYRYYDRVLTINPNYDIDYTYTVEEDFGFLYYVEISIDGNYLTGIYEVTHFNSNVTQQQTNYDTAMMFIDNIVSLYEAIME